MAKFTLHDIPPDLWADFTTKATEEGWPVRPLLTQLMRDYVADRIRPSELAPQQLGQYAWLRPAFRTLKQSGLRQSPLDNWTALGAIIDRDQPHRRKAFYLIDWQQRESILKWLDDTTTQLEEGRSRLTLKAIATFDTADGTRRTVNYEVLGLPPGEDAIIALRRRLPGGPDGWYVSYYTDGEPREFPQVYETAHLALRALEDDVASRESS
jgi:hypothetical protein